jgi:ABC-type polysaccharide/polyol phosphate export permease
MNGLLQQFGVSLRLYFRNKMGMFYGYLFPAIFLLAFWVLYRNEPVPLARHMGQLLTVTILGGACLGMPTTMVSERERGVWRRYRLTPVSTSSLVASTVILRYFIVVTAGLLQLALAISIGMPLPRHPLELWLAFTFVAFAFLGLGLVVATMADSVPAVQALGQCIFLPMLIVGGVAVPLASLPNWAQHVAAFFPGRYAVDALQSCITGNGTGTGFDFLALLLIGVAGFISGAWMFRWDAQQRFATRSKGWLVVVVAAWAVVGLVAESRGRIGRDGPATPTAVSSAPVASEAAAPVGRAVSPVSPPRRHAGDTSASAGPSSWQAVTIAEIKNNTDFDALPPDGGIVSPVARLGLDPPPDLIDQINALTAALPEWQPGKVDDPVQRVRNLLYVAAVPDLLEKEILESYVPLVVFERLKQDIPKDDLIRILYWVATHPSGGEDRAARQLQPLGLENAPADMDTVRERVTIYSLKLLGRLIGKIPSK